MTDPTFNLAQLERRPNWYETTPHAFVAAPFALLASMTDSTFNLAPAVAGDNQ